MSQTIAVPESVLEQVVLGLFEGLGYSVLYGPTMAPEQPTAEGKPRNRPGTATTSANC
jgi:hypothetical protein